MCGVIETMITNDIATIINAHILNFIIKYNAQCHKLSICIYTYYIIAIN